MPDSPDVRKDMAMTSFAMAERALRKLCPEAVCVVVHGRGVDLMLNDAKHPAYGQGQGISFAEVVQRCSKSDKKSIWRQLNT